MSGVEKKLHDAFDALTLPGNLAESTLARIEAVRAEEERAAAEQVAAEQAATGQATAGQAAADNLVEVSAHARISRQEPPHRG